MNDVFRYLSLFAAGAVLKGSIVTAAALALTRALRIHSAKTRFAVILSALIGGTVLGGATNIVPAIAVSASTNAVAIGPAWLSIPVDSIDSQRDPAPAYGQAGAALVNASAESTPARFDALQLVRAGMALAWAAGVLGLFLYWAFGRIVLRRFLGRARVAREGKIFDSFKRIGSLLGVETHARLLLCDARIPFAAGILRPVVCVPREAVDWEEAKLEAALLHELAHLKRRDLLSTALARAALALSWLSPVSWLAYAILKRDREEAADGVVLREGVRPSSYASILLGFYAAPHSIQGLLCRACGITRGGNGYTARRRITRVLSGLTVAGSGYALRRALAIAGVCAALIALGPVRMAYAQTTDAPAIPVADEKSGIALYSIETDGDEAAVTFIMGNVKNTINGSPSDFPLRKPLAEGLCDPSRVSLAFGETVNPFTEKQYYHDGIDIRVKAGTPVTASGSGVVREAGFDEGLGNYVVIEHGLFYSVYAHLKDIETSGGRSVKAGERIGSTGSTGLSTGPHLHFEIRIEGERWDESQSLDPAAFVFREK